jgi:hypothetical protein
MKKLHKLLMTSTAIVCIFGCNIHSDPVQAQPKTYKCESYTRIDGTSSYRVSPSISGSFGFFNQANVFVQCFVPVTRKQCFYKDNNKWYKCGDTENRIRARETGELIFDFTKGIGEIYEEDGKKYHGFGSIYEFNFK